MKTPLLLAAILAVALPTQSVHAQSANELAFRQARAARDKAAAVAMDLAPGHALVFHDAPVVMGLAIFEAFAAPQKHDGREGWTFFPSWEQRRSALQPLSAIFAGYPR